MPSAQPPTKQTYSRGNRRGGGLVLECQYILVPESGVAREQIVSEIQHVLDAIEGNETVH